MILKNVKFKVPSPEINERVQRVLLSRGYFWRQGSTDPKFLDKTAIYIDEYGRLTHTGHGEDEFFEAHRYHEVSYQELLRPTLLERSKELQDA